MSLRELVPWLGETADFWDGYGNQFGGQDLQAEAAQGIGDLELAAMMGSSYATEPLAGIYGALVAAGDGGLEAGGEAVRRAQEAMTYMPRTPEGQRRAMQVGGALSDAAQATGLDDAIAQYQTASSEYLSPGFSALLEAVLAGALPSRTARSTIRGAQRKEFPGIYEEPGALLKQAESQVPDESPALGRLFGVDRKDLQAMAQREGNIQGGFPGQAKRPKGAAAAEPITKPANTGRLIRALETARESDILAPGMEGWYVMDPMYQRLLQLTGDPMEAAYRYNRLNHLSGFSSPSSDVVTEINRGSAANYLTEQGRFREFYYSPEADDYDAFRHNLMARDIETRLGMSGINPDLLDIKSHAYHGTAMGPGMEHFLDTGRIKSKEPKVPLYIGAGGVPETGFQTNFPVGDAHWSRMVGLADTRNPTNKWDASFSGSEAQHLAPWWRDQVAAQVGLESVPAQALGWGLFAPQTGVDTAIGVPKLELWADEIMKASERLGVSPEEARDLILMGRAYAGGRLQP